MGAVFRDKKKIVKYNKYSILYQWNKYNTTKSTICSISVNSNITTTGYIVADTWATNTITTAEFRYVTNFNNTGYIHNVQIVSKQLSQPSDFTTSPGGLDRALVGQITIPANVYLVSRSVNNGDYVADETFCFEGKTPNYDQTVDVYVEGYYKDDGYYYRYVTTDIFNVYNYNMIKKESIVCGSRLYGTVTSKNRSTYPDDGTSSSSSSYWYKYIGETAGKFIETIYAIRGMYPNGGSKDGYYYELA